MYNKKNIGIKITSLFLASLTVVTMGGCSLKKEKTNSTSNVNSTTSVSMGDNAPSIEETPKVEEKIIDTRLNFNKYTGYGDITEKQLLGAFENNITKFDADTQKILRDNFYEMLQNGDSLCNALKLCGIPDKEVLINENYVKGLETLKFIKNVDYSTERESNIVEQYGSSRYVIEEKGIYFGYIFDDEAGKNKIYKEECIHVTQPTLSSDTIDWCDYCIFGEGEANLLSWMFTDGCISNEPSYFFYDENRNIYASYGLGNGYYSLATKDYVYLMALLGYETMASFEQNLDTRELTEKISKNYGIDGEVFYRDMKQALAYASAYNDKQGKEEYISTEKKFWQCMEKRLDGLNTKEEIEQFMELYRFINIQFGAEYFECLGIKDCDYAYNENSKPIVDKSSIDEKLFNKVSEFGILNDVTSNKEDQKAIFKSLTSPKIIRDEKIYPTTILNSKIVYNKETKDLYVYDDNFSFTTNVLTGDSEKLQLSGSKTY